MPRLVANRYEIEGVLGVGGMGAVYRARDRESQSEAQRIVAIKRLSVSTPSAAELQDGVTITNPTIGRFRREFNVMLRLRHPNVVEVRDFGWLHAGEPYFVMEFVQGVTLSTLLRQRNTAESLPGESTIEQYIKVWLQLCNALYFIHQNGMVHRDVKPANLMVERAASLNASDNATHAATQSLHDPLLRDPLLRDPLLRDQFNLKLMDFGLARFADDSMNLTQVGSMMGTAAYISPEQATGGTIDLRTDLYAMGVIMYEMVTGRAPFTADTPWAVVRMHIEARPLAPKFINPALPDYINSIILTLLAKDPNQRFNSADEVAQCLRARQFVVTPASALTVSTRPTLYGRNAALKQLQDACTASWSHSSAQLAVIQGDVGTGKSALMVEMGNWAKLRNATVLRGVSAQTGRMPYGAVAEALSTFLLSRQREDARNELLRDIRLEISRIIPEVAPGQSMSRLNTREDSSLAQSQARLFSAVSQLVRRVARRKPVLWLLDDAQWMGADSLELLSTILRNNLREPVCVVMGMRPTPLEMLQPLEKAIQPTRMHSVPLAALDEASTRRLAEATLGNQATPNAVDLIVRRAEGNPLFIQELAYTLKVERPTPEAIASVNETLSLPVSARIARVMANRLSDLSGPERELLNWAAVYGSEFNLDILASAIRQSADDVAETVNDLLTRHLLQERRATRFETYTFVQQQLREVVYSQIQTQSRSNIHDAVALSMERTGIALPADLEFHFGEAGQVGKAVAYGLQAGDRAREAYANKEAQRFYQRVLERAGTQKEHTDEVAQAHFGLGEVHYFMGNYPQARADFERVLELTA